MMVRENVRCKMKNVKYLYLLDSGLHFPFFIFNDKFAVSGAQAPEFFLQVLEKAWREYENISEHAS